MKISTRSEGEVTVLDFKGNLDTNTAPDAEIAINEMLDEGVSRILINLEELNYVSSSGLRVLLVTAKKMRTTDGRLKICSLNETVREVFEISGFDTILSVVESEAKALAEF